MANIVEIAWYNVALTGFSSCLSIFGGAVIILTYLKFGSIRNYTRTLLVYLTIADLLTAVGNLVAVVRYALIHADKDFKQIWKTNCTKVITRHTEYNFTSLEPTLESTTSTHDFTLGTTFSNIISSISSSQHISYEITETQFLFDAGPTEITEYNTVCQVQSFVTTYSNLSSFLWTTIIAFHIWFSVFMRSRKLESTCGKVFFHLIGWIIPVCIVATHYEYLGEDTCYGTGVWCGIKSGLSRDIVRRVMYIVDVGWQLSCYLLTTFFCVTIKLSIWSKRRYGNLEDLTEISNNLKNDDKNFIIIVLIIYSLKVWGIIRFFITAYVSEHSLEDDDHLFYLLTFLLAMQSYGASGQAFWNFILFCVMDKDVRSKMMKSICCCKLDTANKVAEATESDHLTDQKFIQSI